ncbi:MAG: hypothetical protein KBD12_01055 [Candidatus Pacebacteria bacterium]|nr:hypothetical protein [Candidatus Paceibacterota bacterium]
MYSINFDYFFNLVYNFLLAIRYAILFWILRIDPKDYIVDHKYDTWDGLINRGWISASTTNPLSNPSPDLSPTSIYLGSTHSQSWWDVISSHVFGSDVNNKFLSYSGDMTNYNAANPVDVNFAVSQVNNDPWFYGLHFSIQNPILSFFADIISTFAFFILLILIYSIFQWLYIVFASKRKKKDKEREEKLKNRIERIKRLKEKKSLHKEYVKDSFLSDEYDEKDYKDLEDEEIPAGIIGLPIDESSLSEEDLEILERNKINILNYSEKNKNINKNNLIKIQSKNEITEKDIEAENNLKQYKEKWNIVLNYSEGKDEALWRVGILEADNILNDLLIDRGYQGITIADRLSVANFNTIDLAWAAHKIRNRIAHDGSRFVITERIAKNTFDLYKTIFTEFKIFE